MWVIYLKLINLVSYSFSWHIDNGAFQIDMMYTNKTLDITERFLNKITQITLIWQNMLVFCIKWSRIENQIVARGLGLKKTSLYAVLTYFISFVQKINIHWSDNLRDLIFLKWWPIHKSQIKFIKPKWPEFSVTVSFLLFLWAWKIYSELPVLDTAKPYLNVYIIKTCSP